jgi:hypothetical protein
MDTVTRPKRKRRILTEPHDNYSFYLPVALAEQFRDICMAQRMSFADGAAEALRIFVAANIHVVDMDNRSAGHRNGRGAEGS